MAQRAETTVADCSLTRVYACLGVTCHLRFWQNDRDLQRANAVTRGWNGHRISQRTQLTLEKINSPAAPARIRTRNLSITSSAALLPISYPGSLLHIVSAKYRSIWLKAILIVSKFFCVQLQKKTKKIPLCSERKWLFAHYVEWRPLATR